MKGIRLTELFHTISTPLVYNSHSLSLFRCVYAHPGLRSYLYAILQGQFEITTSRCITGNTLRDGTRNEDVCNICGIQDVIRWTRISRRAWRNRKQDNIRLAKIARNGKPTFASKTLVRELDINITGEQAYWINYEI